MFTTIIVQPIFNLLVLILAFLPGHNFGLALILFTILVRILLYPLLRKQLHQTKKMRALQPELKRIKQEAKGDRQKESVMLMELYKEKGVNPAGSIGVLIIQLPILLGLYAGLKRVIEHPHELVSFSYPVIQHLPYLKGLAQNIHQFDHTLFGLVDLTRAAIGPKGFYLPAFLLVVGSAVIQFFQSRQLLPDTQDSRGLRAILKEAGEGKQADQSEMTAAMSRNTTYLLPIMVFVFTVHLASALSLYWLVGGLVAFLQQTRLLRDDESEMEQLADQPQKKDVKSIPEAEVISSQTKKTKNAKKGNAKKKRR